MYWTHVSSLDQVNERMATYELYGIVYWSSQSKVFCDYETYLYYIFSTV